MNRVEFYAARLLRREGRLSGLSASEDELAAELAVKRVALVGNARALAKSGQGARIDSFDVVVRINRAPLIDATGQGVKTDWLALAVRAKPEDLTRMCPQRILWISPKRKRLAYRVSQWPGFYLHPISQYDKLEQELGSPPSTGVVMASLLRKMPVAQLDLFGFDFFASLSLSGRRTAIDVPHDFKAEADWFDRLEHDDPRVTIVPPRLMPLT